MSKYEEILLDGIKTYPFSKRKNKVNIADFATVFDPGTGFKEFVDSLPHILVGEDFRRLVAKILAAAKKGKPVVAMMGAHVIKCGLGPVLIDLMNRGIISHIALNGGGSIHDFEIARWGQTSEDVAQGLQDGSFGMAEETGKLLNQAVCQGKKEDLGYGETLGRNLQQAPHAEKSLLAAGYRMRIPVTVHVALGTDIVHQHPSASGGAIGETSYRDFRIFARTISRIGDGGVVLNLGSAVILPEVFLKALTVVRNLGCQVERFTTANFDMIQHYRQQVNVLLRPTQSGGQAFGFTGHHEIMIPLLATAVKLGLNQ